MAELGVAASALGVASLIIQVVDSISRLKSFCEAVKEVPEEIRHLIEEIEILGLVLTDINRLNLSDKEDNTRSLHRCISLCRKGADILNTTVRELDAQIGRRRRVGALKAVLKKPLIDRLRDRLRSAQFMLMLSHQAYSE
jgi:hypothetical protein